MIRLNLENINERQVVKLMYSKVSLKANLKARLQGYSKENLKKGFTLIETLVSLAILVIMAALFMTVLSSSIKNIYSSGVTSKSFVFISEEIENLYSMQPLTYEEIEEKLKDKGKIYYVGSEDDEENYIEEIYKKPEGKDFNFLIKTHDKDGIKGFNVIIVYFYNNGEDYVTLTTFFRGE